MRKQDYVKQIVQVLDAKLKKIVGYSMNVTRYGGALQIDKFKDLNTAQSTEVRKAFDDYRAAIHPFDFGKFKDLYSTAEIV